MLQSSANYSQVQRPYSRDRSRARENLLDQTSSRNDAFGLSARDSNSETQRIHQEMANLKILNQKILERLESLEPQNKGLLNPVPRKPQDAYTAKVPISKPEIHQLKNNFEHEKAD